MLLNRCINWWTFYGSCITVYKKIHGTIWYDLRTARKELEKNCISISTCISCSEKSENALAVGTHV